MTAFEHLADLPLTIDSYELEPREQELSEEFTRYTTVIRLKGAGTDGVGEDVNYDGLDHIALHDAGPVLELAGNHTVASYSALLDELDLWPAPPVHEHSRDFRRWAFESAALDLALRQAGRSLGDVLGREPRPVTFVVSMRLGKPPTLDKLKAYLELYPDQRFKLDATSDWSDELIAELVDTGAVDSLDFKGFYKGTPVDQPADPGLYRRVAEAFPDAWLEDPALTPETREALKGQEHRFTWDAPIHRVGDVEALELTPRMINIKPSRVGTLEELCALYEYCETGGIEAYGGGQGELGPGRGQIQYLSSVFHPDTPNDVAPRHFNNPEVVAGLPQTPLAPEPDPTGFRWREYEPAS